MQQPPPTPVQPPKKRRWYNDGDLFLHGFIRSNYVTAFTDWFMSLAGKLAEFVLYVTVLYSGAELYPGVKLPESLNLSVFILQMGALDIGGIGLSKLAKQARDDHNPEGAEKAEALSKWLIRIMIAGIVTVSAEQVISHLSIAQVAQPFVQVVQALVELALVVARAICAVLYGKVVHALKPSEQAQQRMAGIDIEQALADLAKRLDTELSSLQTQVKQRVDGLFVQLDTLSSRHQSTEHHLSSHVATVDQQVDTLSTDLSRLVQQIGSLDTRLKQIEDYQGEQWTRLQQPIQATLRDMQTSGRVSRQKNEQTRLSRSRQLATRQLDPQEGDSLDPQENDPGLDSQQTERGLDPEDKIDPRSRQSSPTGKIIPLSRHGKSPSKQSRMTERVLAFIRTNQREPSLGEIQGWGCARQTAVNSREAARAILRRKATPQESEHEGTNQ